jgi:hypothetical protein
MFRLVQNSELCLVCAEDSNSGNIWVPPRTRSFVILRSVEWRFLTNVSGQPIGLIFQGSCSRLGLLGP